MGKISSLINEILDSKPVYGNNDKYIKTKIKLKWKLWNYDSKYEMEKNRMENTSIKDINIIVLIIYN